VLGIVLSGCAVMQRVAETLSERGLSEAKMTSIERRLARFIGNSRIVVPVIWKLLLAQVLTPLRGQHLYFVLDNMPFRDELTIVYIGLLVHSRVLPVAWAVMPAQTKWDEGQWHIVGRLLDQVRIHLPGSSCTLLADRGLTGMPMPQALYRAWLALSAARLCRTYLSAFFQRQTGTVVEALWADRTQAWLSLVWHSQGLARGNAGHLPQSRVGPRL
jgi:hypothetical protein